MPRDVRFRLSMKLQVMKNEFHIIIVGEHNGVTFIL